MRSARIILAVAAVGLAGCGGYRPIDSYTGVNYQRQPGEAALQAAYKAAQEMVTTSRGNYREPYYDAFDRLKCEQERWLKAPVTGGPQGKHLARWRLKYKVLARRIYGWTSSRRPDRRKIQRLDFDKALRGVEPFLMETELELAKRRPAGG